MFKQSKHEKLTLFKLANQWDPQFSTSRFIKQVILCNFLKRSLKTIFKSASYSRELSNNKGKLNIPIQERNHILPNKKTSASDTVCITKYNLNRQIGIQIVLQTE